ncbi:MAG: DUF5916 domain-containing protein [Planctomycetia bacterium]
MTAVWIALHAALAADVPARGEGPGAAGAFTRPVARAARIDIAPVVDGRLDDPCWEGVEPIGELVQMTPRLFAEPSERTEVRIVHDGRVLYLGVRCFDSEPSKIVATQMQRDAELSPDDRLEMWFDTFRDRRNAYYFQVSAAGSLGDALLSRGGNGFNKPWDGIWEARTAIDDLGWAAEIAIPFDTLGFDPSADAWGFNINRVIQRKLEYCRYGCLRAEDRPFTLASGADLVGMAGAEHGLGLDFVPVLAAERVDKDGASPEDDLQPGFDLFWRPFPGWSTALTVNTDFAEVEVDDRQVNLTRFPLFFPEKRDFFLQDAGIFEFADLDRGLVPFFSRRIGLVDGAEVPILAGAKVTGRTDEWSVGVLDVQTESSTLEDGGELDEANLFAARVARNFGAQSSFGVLATAGDPLGERDDALAGFDLNLRTDDFLDGKNLQGSAWALVNAQDGEVEDGAAFGASIAYPNDVWDWRASAREVQANFDPALGFVPRNGVRQYAAELTFEPRHEGLLRRSEHSIEGSLVTELDDELQTAVVEVQPAGVVFDSGDALRLEIVQERDVVDQAFEPGGLLVPPGTYDFLRARLEYETTNKRVVDLSGKIEGGQYYGGTSFETEVELGWRPNRWFQGSASWTRADLDLDSGEEVVHLGRLRTLVSFTPDLSWANFLQYDTESEDFGVNSRVRWIAAPGSDVYLVWTQDMRRDDDGLDTLDAAIAAKVGWTFRF